MSELNITEASKTAITPLGLSIADFAFKQANEFISMGQTPREAGSIVAHMLLRAAWEVAGCGAVADGIQPDPDKFRNAVEETLRNYSFKEPEGGDA